MQTYTQASFVTVQNCFIKAGFSQNTVVEEVTALPQLEDWQVNCPKHVRQNDSSSCGVFVCWYAEKILLGQATDENFNSDEYRKYIYSVITGKKM